MPENEAAVYSQTGESRGKAVLNPRLFANEKTKEQTVHQVAISMLSTKRNTVADAMTRGEVRGGGRKPWKQKGTGRARAGSIRSPLWKGGGVTFGPTSKRNFSKKINKKMKRAALAAVFSDKVRSGRVLILDKLELPDARTRTLAGVLSSLAGKTKQLGKKNLLVIPSANRSIQLAARNLPNLMVSRADSMNVLDVMGCDSVIILQSALPIIEKTYIH